MHWRQFRDVDVKHHCVPLLLHVGQFLTVYRREFSLVPDETHNKTWSNVMEEADKEVRRV